MTLSITACYSLAEDITPPPGYVFETPRPSIAPTDVMYFPLMPPNPEVGEAIYMEKCAPCHGETGLGDGPEANDLPNPVAPIGDPDLARQRTPEDWFRMVTNGNIDRFMPPFLSLTERQRWDVVSYAFTLSLGEDTLKNGEQLFQDNCARCHGDSGQGDGIQAAGVNNADTVFPVDVCDRLYQQSGGWPGLMNRYALEAIGRAATFPVRESDTWPHIDTTEVPAADETAARIPVPALKKTPDTAPPSLIITRDGKLVDTFQIRDKKVLIGRSVFADLVIDDVFLSKIHLVLLLYSDALVLIDLNSANGTTVNSVRARSTVLKTDDIISLGNHRLKVQYAPAIGPEIERLLQSPDTVKMKQLADIRRQRARRARLAAIRGDKRG